MSDFRIEKIRHPIQLTLVNGIKLLGTVFLEPIARHRSGPQDPRDLLNDDEAFFPFSADGTLHLLAKDQVALATYGEVAPESGLSPRMIDVKVSLADGSVVEGAVEVEVRSDSRRLLDHLNAFEDRFLTMTTAGAEHCLVNRRMIAGIEQR
jgi:hypothetical protein